ncbi:trimeric LpxA-like protein [Podospora australis]|uniref:Trimeric LpxA-like protein n=1 Tax=Podospora australis TaxID=1536484 RepID=A0AAN6WLT8_9PEZI|nr:trimeric LpxA-like protein [Podospora australis]
MPNPNFDSAENKRRMRDGELFYAGAPNIAGDRRRCISACNDFNIVASTLGVPRRQMVELWKKIINDESPLPPVTENDDENFSSHEYPYIDGPIRVDMGFNLKFGKQVYVNFNSIWLDTCTITVGDRTLIGPNCSFYTATHPIDPYQRNGLRGPEGGKPIVIGEDCWFGGSVVVLPGVTIGRGVTVGAGSVVTKDVPDFVVVAGNPAKIIRTLDEAKARYERGEKVGEKSYVDFEAPW